MGSCVRDETALPLETQAECRCQHALPNDRQMVQRIVEPERKTDDQQRRSNRHCIARTRKMIGAECLESCPRWQCTPIEFDYGHVDLAAIIRSLTPERVARGV